MHCLLISALVVWLVVAENTTARNISLPTSAASAKAQQKREESELILEKKGAKVKRSLYEDDEETTPKDDRQVAPMDIRTMVPVIGCGIAVLLGLAYLCYLGPREVCITIRYYFGALFCGWDVVDFHALLQPPILRDPNVLRDPLYYFRRALPCYQASLSSLPPRFSLAPPDGPPTVSETGEPLSPGDHPSYPPMYGPRSPNHRYPPNYGESTDGDAAPGGNDTWDEVLYSDSNDDTRPLLPRSPARGHTGGYGAVARGRVNNRRTSASRSESPPRNPSRINVDGFFTHSQEEESPLINDTRHNRTMSNRNYDYVHGKHKLTRHYVGDNVTDASVDSATVDTWALDRKESAKRSGVVRDRRRKGRTYDLKSFKYRHGQLVDKLNVKSYRRLKEEERERRKRRGSAGGGS